MLQELEKQQPGVPQFNDIKGLLEDEFGDAMVVHQFEDVPLPDDLIGGKSHRLTTLGMTVNLAFSVNHHELWLDQCRDSIRLLKQDLIDNKNTDVDLFFVVSTKSSERVGELFITIEAHQRDSSRVF